MNVFQIQTTEGGWAMNNCLWHFPVDSEGTEKAIVELTLQFLTLHFGEVCDGKGVGLFRPPDALVGDAAFESCESHFLQILHNFLCLGQSIQEFISKISVWCQANP